MEYLWQNINHYVLTHDGQRTFLIIYIGGAAFIALTCGLFYFAIWVAAHFFLELYKYYRQFSKITRSNIFHSFYHCKIDLMFLAMGLCIDVVSHHSLALATANQEIRLLSFLRMSRIESLGRIAKVAKILPRLFGTIKATSCVIHLSGELSSSLKSHEHSSIHWKTTDTIIAFITLGSLVLSFALPLSMGIEFPEIIHSMAEILAP